MCKHIVGCITKQQIVVLSGFSCSLRFLCDFCWFVSVARKHCWLSLMNMMKKGKKKVCKSGSCNNLRNAIWNYFYTKNRQKQGWSECNKCTTFFCKVQVLLSKWFKNSWQLKRNWICNATWNDLSSIDVDGVEIRSQCWKIAKNQSWNSKTTSNLQKSASCLSLIFTLIKSNLGCRENCIKTH